MDTTKLSSKGQRVVPKSIRDAHGWRPGTGFAAEDTPEEMEQAIADDIEERRDRGRH